MLLNSEKIESIKNRNVTFVKNCKEINSFQNYDDIFTFLEFNDVPVVLLNTTTFNNELLLTNSGIIQIREVERNVEINLLQDLILNLIYDQRPMIYHNSFIFTTLKSGFGFEHRDREDVHLFGLFGTTTYRVYYEDDMRFEDYEIEHGDYLYVPCGIKHRSISKTPRAILSIGYHYS